MSGLLKATLMVLGAACVLLLAGAFPVLGNPAVFRGGVMILLGVVAALLALWGGWRLSAGKHAQFLFGLVSLYFTTSGLITAWMYGCKAVEHAMLGGAMWFGALAMACTMVVGGLFAVIFGYFLIKLMQPRLWLAGAHWCCTLIVAGAMVDFCCEQNAYIYATPGSADKIDSVTTAAGEKLPLGFSLQVNDFAVTHYAEGANKPQQHHLLITEQGGEYTAAVYMNSRWMPLPKGHLTETEDTLQLAGRTFRKSEVKAHPAMEFPCLLVSSPMPSWADTVGTVKEYSADCTVYTDHRGRPETRRETLKVNAPIACKDWHIYLLSYGYDPICNKVTLVLQARNAPGRWYALAGMVGLIICTACWCWWRREQMTPEPTDKETPAV